MDEPKLAPHLGKELPSDLDLNDIARELAIKDKNGQKRKHHATRRTFSLPVVIKQPTTFWRVRRRTPNGKHVFQLLGVDKFAAMGFVKDENGNIDWKKTVPLAELTNSKWLAPLKQPEQQRADTISYIRFDEWQDVSEVALESDDIRKAGATHISVSPDRTELSRLEIELPLKRFLEFIPEEYDDWRKIPAVLKSRAFTAGPDIQKMVETLLLLPSPSKKPGLDKKENTERKTPQMAEIFIKEISPQTVKIEFQAQTKSATTIARKWFNQRMNKKSGGYNNRRS